MFSQTKRITLAAAESVDIFPIGSGTAIAAATLTRIADSGVSFPPDNELVMAINAGNETVFRFTSAAGFDGWITITETVASPDVPPFV